MITWISNLWDVLRSGFWFVPAAMVAGAVLLALALLDLDAGLEATKVLPGWLTSSAPSARTILSALAGALLTGTSVVFSITMLVLAQTASQYGSRLLRTISDGNVAQITLGMFLSTSVYCFVVLRTVREDAYGLFVPHVSVAVGVLLGLFSLCALIYFLNDTASSIQAQTVVRSVHGDLADSIERLFPSSIGDDGDDYDEHDEGDGAVAHESPLDRPGDDGISIPGHGIGYLQAVNGTNLMSTAVEHDLVVWIVADPGAFVTADATVAVVAPANRVDDATRRALSSLFLLGPHRTPRHDVVCAINEMVEVGVRALSPGINDPFTAMTCVDYLGAGLRQLARRRIPSPHRRDEEGRIRVVAPPVTFEQVLDASVDMLARHAVRTYSVLDRLAGALLGVAERIVRRRDADVLLARIDWLETLARRELEGTAEFEALGVDLEAIRRTLETREYRVPAGENSRED